jgi:hypothetical protein
VFGTTAKRKLLSFSQLLGDILVFGAVAGRLHMSMTEFEGVVIFCHRGHTSSIPGLSICDL